MSAIVPLGSLVAHSFNYFSALAFLASILLLDAFDISLPRGDSVLVSGSLVSASLVVLGLVPGSLTALVALALAHLIRWRHLPNNVKKSAPFGRVAGLVAAACVIGAARSTFAPSDVIVSAVGSCAYLFTELLWSQLLTAHLTSRPLSRLVRGNFTRLAPLLAAQVSAAILTVMTFPELGSWVLVPVVALLLIIRQSYALLFEVREAYRKTVEVLVEVAEAQDTRLIGHAERTAAIAREIAMRIGIAPQLVDTISYVALLHDVDALGTRDTHTGVGHSSEVLAGSVFFADLLPILCICDGQANGTGISREYELLAAMVVAVASDVDCSLLTDVCRAHSGSAVSRISKLIPPQTKAKVVGAALELGYPVPAVA